MIGTYATHVRRCGLLWRCDTWYSDYTFLGARYGLSARQARRRAARLITKHRWERGTVEL